MRKTDNNIRSKKGIGFISNFLLKARVLYLTILKRKNLSLSLKVETPVRHLFGEAICSRYQHALSIF